MARDIPTRERPRFTASTLSVFLARMAITPAHGSRDFRSARYFYVPLASYERCSLNRVCGVFYYVVFTARKFENDFVIANPFDESPIHVLEAYGNIAIALVRRLLPNNFSVFTNFKNTLTTKSN